MFSTVIVPIDPATQSDTAVPFAAVIARQAGAAVELLAVVAPGGDALEAQARLAELAKEHGLDDERTRVVTAEDAGLGILDAAGEAGSLVCMASRARRPVGELVLGSVSERVVRESHDPVLLIGPHCRPTPDRFASMIVGLDGSPLAESILPLVSDWAAHAGVTPWLFQVLDAPLPLEVGGDDVQDSVYVHRTAERLARTGSDVEWDVARDRHPAATIARFATGLPAPLIALTTHGRSGISRMALGGVALDVARRATVPVLVMRPNEL
jgi:nucleotide-binding universal stress UspA family protein